MSSSYSRADVEMHHDGNPHRPWYPAVNVKVYSTPSLSELEERLGCTEEEAQHALTLAFDAVCEMFWEDVQGIAEEVLGSDVKVYSAGRSNGWCIVQGLSDRDTWDAVALGKWRRFEKRLRDSVVCRTSLDSLCEGIEANQWADVDAEQYNFVDTASGGRATVADLKREKRRAEAAYIASH